MGLPITVHEHPGRKCPKCGGNIEYSTNPFDPDTTPDPGDISICFTCGSVGEYMEGLEIRRLSTQEYEHLLDTSYELREVLTAWRAMKHDKEQAKK